MKTPRSPRETVRVIERHGSGQTLRDARPRQASRGLYRQTIQTVEGMIFAEAHPEIESATEAIAVLVDWRNMLADPTLPGADRERIASHVEDVRRTIVLDSLTLHARLRKERPRDQYDEDLFTESRERDDALEEEAAVRAGEIATAKRRVLFWALDHLAAVTADLDGERLPLEEKSDAVWLFWHLLRLADRVGAKRVKQETLDAAVDAWRRRRRGAPRKGEASFTDSVLALCLEYGIFPRKNARQQMLTYISRNGLSLPAKKERGPRLRSKKRRLTKTTQRG